jgi:hypothetical protein
MLMTKEEKKHYDKVARLGCILCKFAFEVPHTPCEIHHIRRLGGKRSLAPVIGLCPEHHRGNTGIHGLGRKGFEARYGIDEQALLELTLEMIC